MNSRRLKRRGLNGGFVWVLLHDDGIELRGQGAGSLSISARQVHRVRVGYEESKFRMYCTHVWTNAGDKALMLIPSPGTSPEEYRLVIVGFVSRIIACGRTAHVEGGYSKFSALFGPVLTAPLVLGAIAVSAFALTDQPWWGRLIVPVVPTLMFVLLLRAGLGRYWPIPISGLADLEGQLPLQSSRHTSLRDRLWMLVGGRRR